MIWRGLTNPPSSCALCAAIDQHTAAVREIFLHSSSPDRRESNQFLGVWISVCGEHDPQNVCVPACEQKGPTPSQNAPGAKKLIKLWPGTYLPAEKCWFCLMAGMSNPPVGEIWHENHGHLICREHYENLTWEGGPRVGLWRLAELIERVRDEQRALAIAIAELEGR